MVETGPFRFLGFERSILFRVSCFEFRVCEAIWAEARMKILLCLLPMISAALGAAELPAPKFDAAAAERFARFALACVDKEYPNKISHVLNSDADVAAPRKLTPAFYGCYDWHSSVHGHWLLARLARTFPDAPFAAKARQALAQSITPGNIAQEVAYLRGDGRASFERPYGLA